MASRDEPPRSPTRDAAPPADDDEHSQGSDDTQLRRIEAVLRSFGIGDDATS